MLIPGGHTPRGRGRPGCCAGGLSSLGGDRETLSAIGKPSWKPANS